VKKIWAVAAHMIAEGIRMKIAVVFLVLLALVVVALPFSIQGDSSLTGAVQTFMSFSLTATSVLLGMLTIFMSWSVSDELVNRQILLVVTKPLPRWQYIVGKWVGIMTLDLVFLVGAGGIIYAMTHYIRWTHPPTDAVRDVSDLNDQVLVARHAIQVDAPDFERLADREYERNLEQGTYDDITNFNPKDEHARLARKYEARWRIVGPNDVRVFQFKNVLCDRSPENKIQIRYKTDVTNYAPDEVFRALWRFGNPEKGTALYDIPVRQRVGRFFSINVKADAVAADHTLTAVFINSNPYRSEPNYSNVMEFRKSNGLEVLFVVGSFEGNMVRLLTLMYCKLMFLAALALLMTTVFSFPVACLASFTIYALAAGRSFLLDAIDFSSNDYSSMFSSVWEFMVQAFLHLYSLAQWVLPDFGRFDAVQTFVDGRNVSLVWVLQGVAEVGLLKTFIVLGLAILLFHRREVAEVSV